MVDAFFMALSLATHAPPIARSHAFAGQKDRLLHPSRELSFVERIVLMDIEVASVLALGLARGDRAQRCAAEESHLDVLRKAMHAEEPSVLFSRALDSIQRRIPFDGLAHAGDGARDERVEATPVVTFPARHGGDVGLHGGVTLTFRDLRIAA